MEAVTWHGQRDVRVEAVPYLFMEAPTGRGHRGDDQHICRSGLHLHKPLSPFMGVLGHENVGQVVEAGRQAEYLRVPQAQFTQAPELYRTFRRRMTAW